MTTTINNKLNFVYLLFLSIVFITLLVSCEKEVNDPTLEMVSITGQSMTTYSVTAKIVDRGDYKIYDHGIEYYIGQSEGNYYSENKISMGSVIAASNSFTAHINLQSNYYYYSNYKIFAKAYITNERGTIYSKAISINLLQLKVTSVVPSSAKVGDIVTINGTAFSTNPTDNQVKFYSSNANVVSSTNTELRVIVPANISYYNSNNIPVSVSISGYQVTLSNAFQLNPSVINYTPATGTWNTTISINGGGLYGTYVYFDNYSVLGNNSYSSTIYANIPYTIGKKRFKIYIHKNDQILEVPGGYFQLNDLSVNTLSTTTYSRGSSIYFSGNMFNPSASLNKLILGSVTIYAYSSYNSSASFTIPTSTPIGSYQPKITNGVDTVTLSQTIQIVAK